MKRIALFLFLATAWVRAQSILTADGLATLAAPSVTPLLTMNYMAFTNQPLGTVLTVADVAADTLPTNSGNFSVIFSASAPGQFITWTNGPAFPTPIQVSNAVYTGAEAASVQLTNNLGFSTIELAMPPENNLPYLSVEGFVRVPSLANTAATYDLIVLGASVHASPYSTEDWTLQLNCGLTNEIEFEDAGTVVTKNNAVPVPMNKWLYFVMSLNTTNGTEYGIVYNSDGSVLTSCTHAMDVANTFVDYWLFGNNEAGSQSGVCTYFSGLNWTNTPPPPPPPPYTSATNNLVAQYKFNGNLLDASPNAYAGSEYGGSIGWVTGANGTANGAIGVTNATISSAATNPVAAITVSFWINPSAAGMPIAHQEFTSWYAYMGGDGTVQFDLYTSGGHINLATTDDWLGAWHLYTATWDGGGDGKVRIYKDGVLDATSSTAILGTIAASSSNLTIGSGYSGYALGGGALDDVRVYGRALNGTEITAMFAAGADGNINL